MMIGARNKLNAQFSCASDNEFDVFGVGAAEYS